MAAVVAGSLAHESPNVFAHLLAWGRRYFAFVVLGCLATPYVFTHVVEALRRKGCDLPALKGVLKHVVVKRRIRVWSNAVKVADQQVTTFCLAVVMRRPFGNYN